jgi:putrescine transport system ATP-binding protein
MSMEHIEVRATGTAAAGGAVVDDTAGTRSTSALLRLEGVTKAFDGFVAVDRLSLHILPGEFFALLGPSGCGKSTLLRVIAGLETLDSGRVLLDGHDLAGMPPHLRPVNMMFQNYALFPHLSVEDNIAFGLKQEPLQKQVIAARVEEMLALVQLASLAKRKPDQLSGGQRQRVALARSLAKRPKVLLLDEPLAALDKRLRAETQFELMGLQKRLATTFVIVTHDQEEAMTVADRMAVMEQGRIAQVGTPQDIYEQPNSRYVATFIGDVNLLEGRTAGLGADGTRIQGPAGVCIVAADRASAAPGATVWLALRPEKMRIAREPPVDTARNAVRGSVAEVGYLGDMSVYKVETAEGLVLKTVVPNLTRASAHRIAAGEPVWLSWAADAGIVLTR